MAVLGDTTATTVTVLNNVTANGFVKSGGTGSQFLKANGSVDSNAYATTSSIGNGTLTIQRNGVSLGTFTANQSGNTTINIPLLAVVSVSGTTLTISV